MLTGHTRNSGKKLWCPHSLECFSLRGEGNKFSKNFLCITSRRTDFDYADFARYRHNFSLSVSVQLHRIYRQAIVCSNMISHVSSSSVSFSRRHQTEAKCRVPAVLIFLLQVLYKRYLSKADYLLGIYYNDSSGSCSKWR
jgi:hypothetical protein